jgi:DNA-binding transcriptional MerR regulator
MPDIYLLKDLSIKTGFSIYTLKYYLKLGLLKERSRSPNTNFRYFDEDTVKGLDKIKELRKKGLSLKEIKESLR